MAHIKVFRDEEGSARITVNGLDLTYEVLADGLRVVSSGDGEFDVVCVDLRLVLSRLDIGDHENVDAALLVGSSLARMADDVTPLAPRRLCETGGER